jgi:hypothetical protein
MPEQFRYIGTAYAGQGDAFVVLQFERAEGTTFEFALSLQDAERLHGDIDHQIFIARQAPLRT